MSKHEMKISNFGKIIIFVLLLLIIGLTTGIVLLRNTTREESHYVNVDYDSVENYHGHSSDGTATHTTTDEYEKEYNANAIFEVSGITKDTKVESYCDDKFIANLEYDLSADDPDNLTRSRYYLISPEDNLPVYDSKLSYKVENCKVMDDEFCHFLMIYQKDGGKFVSNVACGVITNFSTKYEKNISASGVIGKFSIGYDSHIPELNAIGADYFQLCGEVNEKSDISIDINGDEITIISTSDIEDAYIDITWGPDISSEVLDGSYFIHISDIVFENNNGVFTYKWKSSDTKSLREYFEF